jgi:hypothetical protein
MYGTGVHLAGSNTRRFYGKPTRSRMDSYGDKSKGGYLYKSTNHCFLRCVGRRVTNSAEIAWLTTKVDLGQPEK